MSAVKSYNLKLKQDTYFKLMDIELEWSKQANKKLTKNEVIERLIDQHPMK